MVSVKLLSAIPALPVRDLERSLVFYRDKLGFMLIHRESGFAIFSCDSVVIHLWVANDESWRTKSYASHDAKPIISGAESFIAGTASCRIRVEGIDELHSVLEPLGILHQNAPLERQPWGDWEFGVVDPDGNLVTFFQAGQTDGRIELPRP